tara:strand:- start:11759 stop:12598 length:840 start_codon:yes stop_codon:yes gene_type:complete
MKNKIQIKIINLLNKLFKKKRFNENSNNYKRKLFFKGLLEWDDERNNLISIDLIHNINLESLFFIEAQKKVLINNTKYFLEGGQGNNALLWGSRGTGKSSLVYAIYNLFKDKYVFLMIEIKFFQIKHLPKILRNLEKIKEKIIIYCDDFSFEKNSEDFIIFKNTLEGSLRKHSNIIFYVTSNYRHLVRGMENNDGQQIHKKDATENLISLSDRFGIWLGFHNFDQEKFLKVVFFYSKALKLDLKKNNIQNKALEWALLRGSYSGREAFNLVRFLQSETR